MEDRLADQPEETVHSRPELRDLHQCLCAVCKKIDGIDHISEAQYKTSADQGRDQRGKDLAQGAHDLLDRVLIRLRSRLHRILAHTLDPRVSCKLFVK